MERVREQSGQGATLASALRRRWWLVIVLGVIGAGAGLAAGIVAKPTYTADSALLVGSPNATVDAVPGFAEATQSLASSYARAGESAQVLAPIAQGAGLSVEEADADLSFTPVPDSNIITISASSSSVPQAVRLAAIASKELILYVENSQQQGGLSSALARYRAAARTLVVAQNSFHNLQARNVKPGAAAYIAAETAIAVAQARANALSTEYSSDAQEDTAAAGISILDNPVGATSNRSSTTQKTAVVGLLVGAVLAALIAALLERRRGRLVG